jgi:hypothetical protein
MSPAEIALALMGITPSASRISGTVITAPVATAEHGWVMDVLPDSTLSRFLRGVDDSTWSALYRSTNQLSRLQDDWDLDGAEAPNAAAIENARTVLDGAFRLNEQPVAIRPSAEGGAFILFESGPRTANIECFNDGTVFAAESSGPVAVWPLSLSDSDIRSTILRIREHLAS